jgi:phage gp46-like protein
MADFRLQAQDRDHINLNFDWLQLASGLIDESMELASAVLIALNTDATASETDVLPDPRSTDRRGWWGDLNAGTLWGGWPIGSKLWLLKRAKIVDNNAREGATTARVRSYITACIRPFVDNGICSKFTIDSVVVDKSNKKISAAFTIYRGPKSAIKLSYQPLWSQLFPGA